MLRGVTIVDSAGVVRHQARLVDAYGPCLVTTKPPAASYRYFMPLRALPALARQLGRARETALFLGAGDFHHLTAAMALAWSEGLDSTGSRPMALVVFDAHPDWSTPPPGYIHCGSWLPEVLAMPHVGAVALVGVGPLGSQGLLAPRLLQAVAPAAREGRLRVYPALQETADELASALPWPREVTALEAGLEAAIDDLVAFLGDAAVYISVDKDVVRGEELPGRWSGGLLAARDLLRTIEALTTRLGDTRLVGLDICGEYEPRLPLPAHDPVVAIHEAFNLHLLELVLARRAPGHPTGPQLAAA